MFNTKYNWGVISGKLARKEELTQEEVAWLERFEANIKRNREVLYGEKS